MAAVARTVAAVGVAECVRLESRVVTVVSANLLRATNHQDVHVRGHAMPRWLLFSDHASRNEAL